MKKKAMYRIRNWREYNRALKQRGSLAIWISSEAIANWTTEGLMVSYENRAGGIVRDSSRDTAKQVVSHVRSAL